MVWWYKSLHITERRSRMPTANQRSLLVFFLFIVFLCRAKLSKAIIIIPITSHYLTACVCCWCLKVRGNRKYPDRKVILVMNKYWPSVVKKIWICEKISLVLINWAPNVLMLLAYNVKDLINITTTYTIPWCILCDT